MSKYFIRYSYKVHDKVPDGSGLGWKYSTETVNESCIAWLDDGSFDSIYDVQRHIQSTEFSHSSNKPDYCEIEIVAMNKL
jgi:hypothetical protein